MIYLKKDIFNKYIIYLLFLLFFAIYANIKVNSKNIVQSSNAYSTINEYNECIEYIKQTQNILLRTTLDIDESAQNLSDNFMIEFAIKYINENYKTLKECLGVAE